MTLPSERPKPRHARKRPDYKAMVRDLTRVNVDLRDQLLEAHAQIARLRATVDKLDPHGVTVPMENELRFMRHKEDKR